MFFSQVLTVVAEGLRGCLCRWDARDMMILLTQKSRFKSDSELARRTMSLPTVVKKAEGIERNGFYVGLLFNETNLEQALIRAERPKHPVDKYE
jgi:hypothetical protein